jgi:hypothetical protein
VRAGRCEVETGPDAVAVLGQGNGRQQDVARPNRFRPRRRALFSQIALSSRDKHDETFPDDPDY